MENDERVFAGWFNPLRKRIVENKAGAEAQLLRQQSARIGMVEAGGPEPKIFRGGIPSSRLVLAT